MGGLAEKALAKRLQQARLSAGLTQQQLCQKAGLSYSTLAKIERGAIASPSVFTVVTIAKATGASLEDLLDMHSPLPGSDKKTSKTGVKFVYFDLNSTLVRSYEKAFPQLAKETGLPVDTIEAVYWRYDNDVCAGRLSMKDFNKAMGEKLGLDRFNWSDYYLSAVEPMPGSQELVDWASEHYTIGLLSGTMPGLIDGLNQQGKIDLSKFSKVIDSSVVGYIKNDPEIYTIAQTQAGHSPNEILLIDDDKDSLINADQIGWQICRFNPYDPEESISRAKQHLEFS